VLLADDEAMANIDEALRVAERSSDDLALGMARLSMGIALLYRDSAAERKRGAAVLAQLREMILAKRFYASELPVVETLLAREMAATGDRDRALPMIRNAVDTLTENGQWGYLSATAGVLVDALLARGEEGDIDEAEGVIERLATGPDEGPLYREVWLLRSRALVARARGGGDSLQRTGATLPRLGNIARLRGTHGDGRGDDFDSRRKDKRRNRSLVGGVC
jgi:hypothetical protein